MRLIYMTLDDTTISTDSIIIRQYNNRVDRVVFRIKTDIGGLDINDYNAFVQTDLGRVNKIPLEPCTSDGTIVIPEGYKGYSWLIDSTSTKYDGTLNFEVQLEHKSDLDIPVWQSAVCDLITVGKNICDSATLGDEGPTILQSVYQKLGELDDQAEQAAASATAAAESQQSAAQSATDAAASNTGAAAHETAAKGFADTAAEHDTAAGLSATAAAASEAEAARYAAQTAGVSTISWHIDPDDGGLNMIYNPDITT